MAGLPPLHVKCPSCGEVLELQRWLLSEWDTSWTDGYNRRVWRLRNFDDDLYRGNKCGIKFWRTSAEVIPNPYMEFVGRDSSGYVAPPLCENLDSNSILLTDVIEEGMCQEISQELYVRMRLWWNLNAPFRPMLDPVQYEDRSMLVTATIKLSDAFVQNARRLIDLLQPTNARELILIADLHRQLGEFDTAISLLTNAADLLTAVHESEREQSRIFQARVRAEVGDDPLWVCPAEAEDLQSLADSIIDFAMAQDQLVRPVVQKFTRYKEAQPTNAGPARGLSVLSRSIGIDPE